MNRLIKIAALAIGVSFAATSAMACGPDGCGKDKDGKMSCCCDDMKDHKDHMMKDGKPGADTPGAPKPDAAKPAGPDAHKDHQH